MNNINVLLETFIRNHGLDAVRLLERLEVDDVTTLIKELPIEISVNLFSMMELQLATACCETMEMEQAVQILELLPSRISSSILRRMQDENRSVVLEKMDPKISNKMKYKLNYSKNTVAALMVTNVPTVSEDMSIKETLEKIRKDIIQTYEYIFIVNRDQKMVGIGNLHKLIATDSKNKITSIMETEFPYLTAEQNANRIVKHPGWLDYNILPVIDHYGILIGTISRKNLQQTTRELSGKIPDNLINAGNALGELYKIGLTSLLSGITQTQEEYE